MRSRLYPLLATLACAVPLFPIRAVAQPTGVIDAHDPSPVTKQGTTYYYYATGQGIISRTSTDETAWSAGPSVFASPPAWTTTAVPGFTGFFWAPDAVFLNNQYYLYYAVSTFGSKVSAIGLATSPTLNPGDANYAWTDQGPLIQSGNSSNFNAIDPAVLQDTSTGRLWMSYGSYNSGIFIRELDPASGKPLISSTPVNVAYNAQIEASALVQHGGFYYLFVNWGVCCSGINSTYNIRVGRSTSPTGPFLDQNGTNMVSGGGTLFYQDDGARVGPGQFGFYTEGGQDQFSYHYYDGLRNGAPAFGLSNLYWTSDNWPSVAPVNPNWSGAASANWSNASNWSTGAVPSAQNSIANFATNAAGRYVVTLDAPETVSRINFTSATPFTIGVNGGNTLTLSKMALDAQATINVSAGNHTIAAPISTSNNVGIDITPATSSLTLSGSLTAGSLYKFGHGVLILSGHDTYSGEVSTRAGTLSITGTLSTTANLTAGNIAGDAGTIIISGSANVSVGVDFNIGDTGDAVTPATGTLYIQNNANIAVSSSGAFVVGSGFFANTAAVGTVYQSGGTLTANGNFDGAFIIGGRNSPLPTGAYNLLGGTVIANTNVRIGGYGAGTVNQSGGLFTSPNYISIGRFAGANGTWNISGGQLNVTNATRWLLVGEGGTGTLNISGTGSVTTANVIRVGHSGGAGTINLAGGSLTTTGIQRGTGSATFKFNGGTLIPASSSTTFLQGLTSAYVQAGGALINTNAQAITIAQPFLHDPALAANPDGGLAKSGAGMLTLTGANTYTGGTMVNGGVLSVSSNANLGDPATGAALTLNGGTLQTSNSFALDNGGAIKRNVVLGAAGGTVNLSGANALTVSGVISGTTGPLNVNGSGSTLLITGAANYGGLTTVGSGATLEFGGGVTHTAGMLNAAGTIQVDAGTTLNSGLPTSSTVNTLVVNGMHRIIANNSLTNRTGRITTLTIGGAPGAWTGLLDLTNNNLIVGDASHTTSFANIQSQIVQAAGVAAPANPWNGTGGITSSSAAAASGSATQTALGFATGAEYTALTGATLFDSLSFNSTDTLVKYTLVGDANLDGTVNINDFFALSGHITLPGDWSQGDFNYTGTVDINDFFAMTGNFGKTLAAGNLLPGGNSAAAAASVPEPMTLNLLAWASLGLLARRPRRRVRRGHG